MAEPVPIYLLQHPKTQTFWRGNRQDGNGEWTSDPNDACQFQDQADASQARLDWAGHVEGLGAALAVPYRAHHKHQSEDQEWLIVRAAIGELQPDEMPEQGRLGGVTFWLYETKGEAGRVYRWTRDLDAAQRYPSQEHAEDVIRARGFEAATTQARRLSADLVKIFTQQNPERQSDVKPDVKISPEDAEDRVGLWDREPGPVEGYDEPKFLATATFAVMGGPGQRAGSLPWASLRYNVEDDDLPAHGKRMLISALRDAAKNLEDQL